MSFFFVFFSPFSIAITSLGEERANLSFFFVRLFGLSWGLGRTAVCDCGTPWTFLLPLLCLFGFVGFLFLLVSGKGCGLRLWHSLDFSLTFFFRHIICSVRMKASLNISATSPRTQKIN